MSSKLVYDLLSRSIKAKPKDKTIRKLTKEQSLILDIWYKYAISTINKKGMWDGGVGILRIVNMYLREHKIINSWGNKRPEIIW